VNLRFVLLLLWVVIWFLVLPMEQIQVCIVFVLYYIKARCSDFVKKRYRHVHIMLAYMFVCT